LREGGCLGLRWLPFYQYSKNQMEDGVDVRGCVGEEARPGQNVWGGWLPIIWGGILIDEKKERWEDPLP
jgi:hypothetical protein